MTTQLINEATYNAFITIPVASRNSEIQDQIEAYETANSLNVDAEDHAPTSLVEPAVTHVEVVDTNIQDAAHDESGDPEWTLDSVEQDAELAEQMQLSLDVLDNQLSITDQRYKYFLALAAKATCLVKWTGPFILDVRVGDNVFAKHVANTLGLLSFNHLLAESVLNKEIKEHQLLNKYVTICSVPLQAKRDTTVSNYDQVKKGCQFVVHTQAMKYVHNDNWNIAKLENIFSSEEIKEPYKETSTPILRVRLKQQEWVEKNESRLATLVTQFSTQHKMIAPKVKAETFKAWSGILVLALLWNKDVYTDMIKLMNEFVGTQPLEVKVKLACALSIVIPEYETFIARFNSDKTITTKLLGNLLKSVGINDTEISQGFTDLQIAMKDHKGGYTLEILKNKYIELVDFKNLDIQKYLKTLKHPETSNSESKLAA